MTIAPIDRLPPDVRAIVDSTMKLIGLYIPGTYELEMLVGRNVKATLKIEGGCLSREVIEDILAHLAFYKKYFPKDATDDRALDTPEKILEDMAQKWELHRSMLALRGADEIRQPEAQPRS